MKYLLIIVLSVYTLSGAAQNSSIIKRAFAFSRVIMPGNIPVDENGTPMDGPKVLHSIVVEVKSNIAPVWKSAKIKGKTYTIHASPVAIGPLEMGQQKTTMQNVVIRPATGNKLWLLELDPYERLNDTAIKPISSIVILTGTVGGKKLTHAINKEVELYSPPSY